MIATVKKYPEFFSELKLKLKKLIKKHNIIVSRKKFRSNIGSSWADDRKIKIPIIVDIESVYVVLHEIGHVVLNHGIDSKKPLYLEELEAELYALRFFKEWKINKYFPEDYNKIKQKAQRYVRWNIIRTIQQSLYESTTIILLKHVHVVALKFSKIEKFQRPSLRSKKKSKNK